MFLGERDFHARHRPAGEIALYARYSTGDAVPGRAGAMELPLTSRYHVAMRQAGSIISRPIIRVRKAYEWGCRVE
jgi:hypothetical protein